MDISKHHKSVFLGPSSPCSCRRLYACEYPTHVMECGSTFWPWIQLFYLQSLQRSHNTMALCDSYNEIDSVATQHGHLVILVGVLSSFMPSRCSHFVQPYAACGQGSDVLRQSWGLVFFVNLLVSLGLRKSLVTSLSLHSQVALMEVSVLDCDFSFIMTVTNSKAGTTLVRVTKDRW